MKLLSVGLTLLAIATGFISFQFLAPRGESFGLFVAGDENSVIRFGLTYLATIGGVFLGSLYRALSALKDAGVGKVPRRFIAGRLQSVDMWLGLVASPVVFALLMKASDGMTLPGLIILALENGFCALIIIESFTRKQAAAGAK